MANRLNRRVLGIGELGRRLLLAFIGVAIAATVADVIVSSTTTGPDIHRFVNELESRQAHAAAQAAGAAYLGPHDWESARLTPLFDLIDGAAAALEIRDISGAVVRSSPGYASYPAEPSASAPVYARGHRVGSITIRYGRTEQAEAAARFAAKRWRIRLYAGTIAVLVALIVSVAVTRRITMPVERMLTAMRERSAGNRRVRIEDERGIGVLRELLKGFNASADALDRQDRAQRNLIANVAHELRTPVAVLQAGHEAMLDGITEPTPDNLGSLRDEVLRLRRRIEDLQALAEAEAAALQLKLVPHDLAAIAAEAAASLKEAFELGGIRFTSRLAKVIVPCDHDRMREIAINLLTNAMKYTPSGGSVVIDTCPYDRDAARLTVRDTGIGIPPDELPHVAERFFRGKGSREMAAGSGFGLTIVSELVDAHHGELAITSEPGTGTQVTVTIPTADGLRDATRRWHAAG